MSMEQSNKTKPLNPLASPYHKVTPHHVVYFSQHQHPGAPVKKKKRGGLSAFDPVALGPRFRQRFRKLKPSSPSNKLVWVPKQKSISNANENQQQQGGTRWKNNSGGYQQILAINENTTSLMIKNIPNKYTRELMVQTLDNHCHHHNKNKTPHAAISSYDFLYLPIDFKRRVNAGFAFVNFTNPEGAKRFRDAFHGKRWDLFGSPKIAEISRARIQGKEALTSHCNSMDFSYGSQEDMPVYFEPPRDGSTQDCCYNMFTVGSFWSLGFP